MVQRRRELAAERERNGYEEPVKSPGESPEPTAREKDNGWTTAFHARTRAIIDATLSRAEHETSKRRRFDGQSLNWLASALERLAELERILDGRPLPGTLKPQQPKAAAQTSAPAIPTVPTPAKPGEPARTRASVPARESAVSEHLPISHTPQHSHIEDQSEPDPYRQE